MKSGFTRIEKRIQMIKITKDTLVMIPGFDEELNLEELAQAIAIVKEHNAPRYRLPLDWESTNGTSLLMIWDKSIQDFVIGSFDEAEANPYYRTTFTQAEWENLMASVEMNDKKRAYLEDLMKEV